MVFEYYANLSGSEFGDTYTEHVISDREDRDEVVPEFEDNPDVS